MGSGVSIVLCAWFRHGVHARREGAAAVLLGTRVQRQALGGGAPRAIASRCRSGLPPATWVPRPPAPAAPRRASPTSSRQLLAPCPPSPPSPTRPPAGPQPHHELQGVRQPRRGAPVRHAEPGLQGGARLQACPALRCAGLGAVRWGARVATCVQCHERCGVSQLSACAHEFTGRAHLPLLLGGWPGGCRCASLR